jgi:hypothetical protein
MKIVQIWQYAIESGYGVETLILSILALLIPGFIFLGCLISSIMDTLNRDYDVWKSWVMTAAILALCLCIPTWIAKAPRYAYEAEDLVEETTYAVVKIDGDNIYISDDDGNVTIVELNDAVKIVPIGAGETEKYVTKKYRIYQYAVLYDGEIKERYASNAYNYELYIVIP